MVRAVRAGRGWARGPRARQVSRVVTITGGSGFVGQLLRPSLSSDGWTVRPYDPFRGPVVNLLRRRWLATSRARGAGRAAARIRAAQKWAEPRLAGVGVIRRHEDDILAEREAIARRLKGSQAVIHLAGIPHPHQPGARDEDFMRLNYEAAVNVFEAAREAGVGTFVFASSAQVYRINDPVRITQFPILESEHLPLPAEGQTAYGFLKGAFERYLAGACRTGATQGVSLRLEYPAMRSTWGDNLFVCTSLENLRSGFACALRPPADLGFEAFNLADADVDPSVADIQLYLRTRWPYVPNHTSGNQCLLSTEKARRLLGYRAVAGGRYVDEALVW